MALRIPSWSKNTEVTLNGEPVSPKAGEYLNLGILSAGDRLILRLDFTLRLLYGEGDRAGYCSVYRGPLLLGYDSASNPMFDFDAIPAVDTEALIDAVARYENYDRLNVTLTNGIILNDFYNLGQSGSVYRTWLPV
jgi:DUF1680 family protein